jgi:hypothetical protein
MSILARRLSDLSQVELSLGDVDLAVRHLHLRTKVNEILSQAVDVERAADCLRIAAADKENQVPPLDPEGSNLEKGDASLVSPPLNYISHSGSVGAPQTFNEAVDVVPTENLIAHTVSDLYDRLGGFIKG